MKIEDVLKEIMICIEHNDKIGYYLDNEDLQTLLNYITTLQRKEYNNSKAIEYINIYEKDFDNYNLIVLKGILKGVVIPVFENEKGE